MRVFITGASGFLGSYVVQETLARGHKVAVLSRQPRPWRLLDTIAHTTLMHGSLYEHLWHHEFLEFKPDAVIHCAWDGVQSRNDDSSDQLKNLHALNTLLNLAKQAGCKYFVGIGSQAEYGLHEGVIQETTYTKPLTAYGKAKLQAFECAKEFCAHQNIDFAWLRVFSIYGPKDNPDWLIPYLIRTLLAGNTPRLTSGEQKWGFLFAADAAQAILKVLDDSPYQLYNLGSNQVCTLRTLAQMVQNLVNPQLPIDFGALPYRSNQIMHLEADISRLNQLGWSPTTSLEKGLEKTASWFKEKFRQKCSLT